MVCICRKKIGNVCVLGYIHQRFTTRGDFGNVETFLVVTTGCEGYWHPVGRAQGCCQTYYNVQDSPLPRRIIQHKMSV